MEKKNWNCENRLSKTLFVMIIVYAVISLYVLLWGRIGIIPGISIDSDVKWIYYAIISFALIIFISVFHLGKSILQRKKKR